MRVEVINTGTELMLGGTINTHLAFIARELFALGLRIQRDWRKDLLQFQFF